MTSELFHKIDKCRVCGNSDLYSVLDLGNQYLSGIFPKEKDLNMPKGPLHLVKCSDESGGCGHVQLEHTFDLPTMYGNDYGYRSGLNSSMVNHLKSKAERIKSQVNIKPGDIVVDIAGNDGTFLGFFDDDVNRLIIDPTAEKFSKFIPSGVEYSADFFSKKVFKNKFGNRKAKVVTSFSMFYDLENPCDFARQVYQILRDDGIWVLEQSYVSLMLDTNSFDTVCHEHLSYYAIAQLRFIMEVSGLKIVDIEFNDVNGGSVSLVVCKNESKREECTDLLNELLWKEKRKGLKTNVPWINLSNDLQQHREEFVSLLKTFKSADHKIAALGASTKGNVTLQTWGIGPDYIEAVGDVNPDKFGCFTPGTWIPIIDENIALEEYNVFVILPWHFRDFFINNPKFKGKTLIFPLPTPEVVIL